MRGHPSGGSFKGGQIDSPLWVRVGLDEGSSKRGVIQERSAGGVVGGGGGGGGAGGRGGGGIV
jgi:hypothetical protein